MPKSLVWQEGGTKTKTNTLIYDTCILTDCYDYKLKSLRLKGRAKQKILAHLQQKWG